MLFCQFFIFIYLFLSFSILSLSPAQAASRACTRSMPAWSVDSCSASTRSWTLLGRRGGLSLFFCVRCFLFIIIIFIYFCLFFVFFLVCLSGPAQLFTVLQPQHWPARGECALARRAPVHSQRAALLQPAQGQRGGAVQEGVNEPERGK